MELMVRDRVQIEKIKDMIFRTKSVSFFLLLNNEKIEEVKTMGWLSRITGVTFPWTKEVIDNCEIDGLVTKEKDGRHYVLTLTKKGRFIAEKLRSIYDVLERK